MKYKSKIFFYFKLVFCFSMINFLDSVKSPKRSAPSLRDSSNNKDPFSALGIPDLNPKALLKELESENKKDDKKPYTQLKTIEDLPKFLANSNLNEDDGIKILTKFLIQVIIMG